MIKGTVKFFNNAKGFGFISPDDGGKDVFLPAATITASGAARLKPGQRVSFEPEPDVKGPKAVKLTLLEEEPVPVAPPVPRIGVTVYHDPSAQDSELVLEALADAGFTPRLVDYVAAPPAREELKRLSLLLREADQNLVRRYDPLFFELQLDDRFISDSDFWTAIHEHPSLINGPVVQAGNKARLCRTANDVRALLGGDTEPAPRKPKTPSPLLAAMLKGGPVSPATEQPEAVIVKAAATVPAPVPARAPAAVIKLKPKPRAEAVPEPKPQPKPEKATAKTKPVAKAPEKKPAVKKVVPAAKPKAKAKPAPRPAKKKK